MSGEVVNNMYGYASDEQQQKIPFVFGLNPGVTTLKKFEWIPNGGKDGAEQEALEIIFDIDGTEKSYRKFPVTQAFGKNGEVITDKNSPEFKDAVMTFNSVVSHILHCFVDLDKLRTAFNVPIPTFKDYARIAASVLPANFNAVKLDMFMQYQWQIRAGQTRTFLEIPGSMKNGKWLCVAVPPVGKWKEVRAVDPADNLQDALYYVDDAGNRHPFTRYGRYMKSNLAIQQKTEEGQQQDAAAANIAKGDIPPPPPPAAAGTTASGW